MPFAPILGTRGSLAAARRRGKQKPKSVTQPSPPRGLFGGIAGGAGGIFGSLVGRRTRATGPPNKRTIAPISPPSPTATIANVLTRRQRPGTVSGRAVLRRAAKLKGRKIR